MARVETQPGRCPECGADTSAGAEVCPSCKVSLFTDPGPADTKPSEPARDTVIEKSLLSKLNAADEPSASRTKYAAPSERKPGRRDELPVGPGVALRSPPPKERVVAPPASTASPTPSRPAAVRQAVPPPPDAGAEAAPALAAASGGSMLHDDEQPPLGALGLVAAELEEALEGVMVAWGELALGDHLSLFAAGGAVISTFLPWYRETLGVLGPGAPFWLFVVAAVALVVRRVRLMQAATRAAGQGGSASTLLHDDAPVRRTNLLQILVGFGAVAYLVLLVFGLYLSDPSHLDVRFGWYVALFFATGLAYGGISRFVHDARAGRR